MIALKKRILVLAVLAMLTTGTLSGCMGYNPCIGPGIPYPEC